MSENYNKIEEKLDNRLEQLQEQQKINNSIMDVLTQVLLKDLLNDYGREIDKLVTKIEYSDQFENLENYFKEYKIFIETSSILDDNMEKFLNYVSPLIQKYKNKIYIPYKVIRDIELNKNNSYDGGYQLIISAKRNDKDIMKMLNFEEGTKYLTKPKR